MSYIFTFDEKRKPISLTVPTDIGDDEVQDIELLIDILQKDLNHNVIGSSAKRFNEASLNFPIILEPIFLEYLQNNLNLDKSNQYFSPFTLPDAEKRTLNDIIIVDLESKSVVKSSDVKFNSLKMLDSFILNKLKDFLLENNIKDFLLQRENNYIAFGNSNWVAKFEIENLDELVNLKLLNEAVKIVDYYELPSDDSNSNKFGAIEDEIMPVIYILHGQNIDYLTVVKNMMKSFNKRTKIQEASNLFNVSVTTVTKDKRIERFDPVR